MQTCRVLIGKEISSKQSPENNVNTFSAIWKTMPKNSNISKAHEKKLSQISYAIKSGGWVKLRACSSKWILPSYQSQENFSWREDGNTATASPELITVLEGLLFFKWLFGLAQEFEMKAWPTGGKLVLNQGRQEHSQQLHSPKCSGLLSQGGVQHEWDTDTKTRLLRGLHPSSYRGGFSSSAVSWQDE